jgi:integrase
MSDCAWPKAAGEACANERRAGFDTGKPFVQHATKITFKEMAARLRDDYKTNKQDSATLGYRLAHLESAFGARRMASLRGADISAYRGKRQSEGASAGTINRELSVLARAFALGRELELLNETTLRISNYRTAESAPRAGFFEASQFEAVLAHLAPDLQLACLIAYRLGWRMQSEILSLEKRHVDVERGTLSLDPGSTKNDDGRIVWLPPDLKLALQAQLGRLAAYERASGRVCRYLFTHTSGRFAGVRISDFRRAWATACRLAGVAGRLRHDFRRTAVREMVNASVPERVAMKITGHRTRSVFDRYHIVSPGDLQRAAQLMSKANQQSEGVTRGASKA